MVNIFLISINLLIFFINICEASNIYETSQTNFEFNSKKKYNLSICAIFKTLPRYLEEWIEYHRLIGVDHFYLYNNTGKIYYTNSINSYINRRIITLIDWPIMYSHDNEDPNDFIWALSSQVPAYENVIKLKASNETKWLVFMNINEFLVPNITDSLSELLDIYSDKPAITLSEICFDGSNKDARKLIIESLRLVIPPPLNPQKEVSKTIFKPEQWNGFTWPPYKCILKNNQTDIKIEKSIIHINRYINKSQNPPYSNNLKDRLSIDAKIISQKEIADLLSDGYQIEDTEPSIHRFVPSLKKKLANFPLEYRQNINVFPKE